MTSDIHLRAINLSRFYKRGEYVVRALDEVSVDIHRGEFISLVGSSGSGKSTLLNLLAGLDTPTGGTVEADGALLSSLSRKQISAFRAHKVGMIFQSFNLVPHYNALKNVEAALLFNGTPAKERTRLATAALERLGLHERLTHKPADLSGGEQQRVAVARAIVKNPEVLFADEPTGNLDKENTLAIAELLKELHAGGLTVVVVTHNLEMAQQYSQRMVKMVYGKVVA